MNPPSLLHLTKHFEMIPAQAIAAAATATYETYKVDCQGAMGVAQVLLSCSAGGADTSCIVTIEESDSSTFATGVTTVTFTDGTTAFTTVANKASFQEKGIQLQTRKRYLRAKTVVAGNPVSFAIAMVANLGGYADLVAGGKTFS